MSAQDRQAEREVADWYAETRAPTPNRGPLRPRIKRFGSGFLTGLVAGSWIRSLFR